MISHDHDDSASPDSFTTIFIKIRAGGIEDVLEAYEKIKVTA